MSESGTLVVGTLGRTFRALRHRNFRLFFMGQTVSLTGAWMQSLAQGWLVWRLSHSAFLLGLVSFCQLAPVLVFGLLGGVAADRFDRRRIVVVTQTVALIQAALLATLTLGGWIAVEHILALAVVMGVVNAFDMPGRQALLVRMVGKEDLGNAIALNSSVFNGARIVGPAIAGVVVGLWGEGACFAVNAVSYLPVIASFLAMKLPAQPQTDRGVSAWAHLKDGLEYAWSTRHTRWLLMLMALVGFLGFPYLSFLPAVAGGVFERGPRGLGALLTSAGLGALTAAFLFAHRRGISGLGRVAPLAAMAFGAALVLFSISRVFVVSCALVVAAGFFMMTQMATTNTILQNLVPDRLRGRLMSLYTMTLVGLTPLGSLLMGRFAAEVGVLPVLGVSGALLVVAGAAFLVGLPRSLLAAQSDRA